MHKILIERSAERDLKNLTADLFKRLVTIIQKLEKNPRPRGCHKIKSSKNYWRIREGKYRIIYEVDDSTKEVRIMRVKHRKDAYK